VAKEENKETKVESKKLEDLKQTPENKKVIAEAEGKVEEVKDEKVEEVKEQKVEKKEKKESKPAVEKASKKGKKVESKVEIEREYVVPLRKGFLNVPHYRRAKKAVKVLKEFMVRHMNVRDGDTRKVKVNIHLNNEIWFRGIKKPVSKIKVKAKKIDGIVYVELVDVPDVVKFKMAREAKAKIASESGKKDAKPVKKEKEVGDKDKDGVEDKKQEDEGKKAGAEKAAKVAKVEVKAEKHTAQGKHAQKTMPVRKVLK
jgi:large subunit ribosomal protein L31e